LTASAVLVGAVLTFATTDASELQLTVTLSATAAVSLAWGEHPATSTRTAGPYTFRSLAAPREAPLEYRLSIDGAQAAVNRVRPIGDDLRIAIYGDSRGGPGPHATLIEQIAASEPHVLVHTGDVIRWAGDRTGWTEHLASVLPISAEVPLVLALGNHEIFEYWKAPPVRLDPLVEAMMQIPPPDDPIAKATGAAPASFHVRIGGTLIVSIDSNAELLPEGPVLQFLDRALEANRDAKLKLVALHHGPRSSGHHGAHPESERLLELAKKHGVHAFLAGHDHVYERVVQDGLTVLVSGGGGAPLYQRESWEPGSRAFSSTYNWVRLDAGEKPTFTAYSLEGVVLDRDRIPPAISGPSRQHVLELAVLGALVFSGAFAWVVVRIVMGRVR
jgi:hypothetical protein